MKKRTRKRLTEQNRTKKDHKVPQKTEKNRKKKNQEKSTVVGANKWAKPVFSKSQSVLKPWLDCDCSQRWRQLCQTVDESSSRNRETEFAQLPKPIKTQLKD